MFNISPKKICASLLIFLFFLISYTQTKPSAETSPATKSNLADIDDEQLLTYLLSEKTPNLHQWGSITQFHGLPSDRVNAIAQTADGILWFGTDLGLAKFDGRRVQTVSAEIFSNQRILVIKTDSAQNLWIGTEKGAFRFINNAFQLIPQTSGFVVNSIVFAANDRIFLTAENGKILEVISDIQGALNSRIIVEKPFETESLGIVEKKIFIGTKEKGLFQTIEGNFAEQKLISKIQSIKTIAFDQNSNLVIGSANGLFYGDSAFNLKPVGENLGAVNAVMFENAEKLWVTTNSKGVFLFRGLTEQNHFTFENTAGGLRSNEVFSVFVDREKVIWFGTSKGVSKFDPNSPFSEKLSTDDNSKFIRSLFRAQDGKVFAGTNRGLFVRQTPGNWELVEGFEKRTIHTVGEDSSGFLWLGTSRGLYKLKNPSLSTVTNPQNPSANQTAVGSIRALRNFQGKTYLAIFGQGLAKLENSNSTMLTQNLPETKNVLALNPDTEKKLWIGTAESGVFSFDGNQLLADARLADLKKKAVWAIEGSEEKGVWFATGRGLFRFFNNELQTILPETAVRAIAVSADSADVWCATEKNGLIRVAFDKEFGWISSRLDVEQGLPSQKIFTLLKLPDETLLIGTNRGVVSYKIPDTRPILIPSRILSRRIHDAAELKSLITLEYPQNTLTIDVAAISSRTFPEQFQYAYILRDDADKIVKNKLSKDSQFLMDNLGAGSYRLEIRAFDKNLIASEPLIFSLKVENAPFPWITLLLSVLLLIALTALIWAIFSQRKIFLTSAELKQTNLDLNAARLDLANEAERERRRISRDLHDQTLADLRHLQLLSDKIPNRDENAENAGIFRREIENVSKEIRRICEDLSPSVLENIGFAAALEYALSNANAEIPDRQKFETEFICPENLEENLLLSANEQIQVYRIVQEVLNNIARHAGAEKVKLTAEIVSQNKFLLQIEDDGNGFDFENATLVKGRGLSNIKSRAALIEADIAYLKSKTGGTIFRLEKLGEQ